MTITNNNNISESFVSLKYSWGVSIHCTGLSNFAFGLIFILILQRNQLM